MLRRSLAAWEPGPLSWEFLLGIAAVGLIYGVATFSPAMLIASLIIGFVTLGVRE